MKKKLIINKEFDINFCLKEKDKEHYYLGNRDNFDWEDNENFQWDESYDTADDSVFISSEYWEECPGKLEELVYLIPDEMDKEELHTLDYNIYVLEYGFFIYINDKYPYLY